MWQIDNETRIAPRRTVAHTLGIDQYDARIGLLFGQTSGCCKSSKASANYGVVCLLFTA
ncbi:hypothetical protein D3C75_1110650 [compost metagenome]